MASKNEFTGDLQQTKGRLSEEGRANYDLAFPPKAVKRGRYKQCRDTGKFIPISEWNALYASEPVEKTPMVIMKGFDAFKSPTSGEIISNNRQLDYDMAKAAVDSMKDWRQSKKKLISSWLKRTRSCTRALVIQLMRLLIRLNTIIPALKRIRT